EGVEGLVHVSEMSWSKKVKNPSKVVSPGDTVEAIVSDVNREARRISLSLKDTLPDPWESVVEKYAIGSHVSGKVRNLTDFGVFVQIEGLVEGLMHVSETSLGRGEKPQDHYKEGDPVRARILRIEDAEMKVGLSGQNVEDEPASSPAAEASAEPGAGEAEQTQ